MTEKLPPKVVEETYYSVNAKYPGIMTRYNNGSVGAKIKFALRDSTIVEAYTILTFGYYGPGSDCEEYEVKEVTDTEYYRLLAERDEAMKMWLNRK